MIAALSPGEAPIGAIRGDAVGERMLLRRGRFGGYKEDTCARAVRAVGHAAPSPCGTPAHEAPQPIRTRSMI